MDRFIKVTGTEGKVGGYFCRLPPLNENTGDVKNQNEQTNKQKLCYNVFIYAMVY